MKVEVYEKRPDAFNPQVEVAACYLDVNGKILFLQNSSHDTEPGEWGVPGGKMDAGEAPWQSALRELYEETGIAATRSQMQSLGPLYIRKPELEYVFHLFHIKLLDMPLVQISAEHQEYRWVKSEEIETLALLGGALEAYKHYAAVRQKRVGASVNAYLILKKGNQVLLQLRKNTGYCDGMWSLVAGHVEDGESATEGMIREAREEIGIHLSQLKAVHILHRKSNRLNVDVFFEAVEWENEIQNLESDKCEKLEFFSLDKLPSNLVDYNLAVLQSILEGTFYSELGW